MDQHKSIEEERNDLIKRLAKIDKVSEDDLIAKLEGELDTSQVFDHLKFLQACIDKYDAMGGTIRNWTIGLWTGTLVAGLLKVNLHETNYH